MESSLLNICKIVKHRGANLSPFGEIRRFHLEIGHSRESCRSVKKKNEEGGGSSDLRVIWVTSPAAFLSPVGNGRNRPALLCLWLAYLGAEACTGASCLLLSPIFFMPVKRTRNTLSVLIVQIRIRYHLNLQRVYFYFCIVIITTK